MTSIHQNSSQGNEFAQPGEPMGVRNLSTMPAPKKLVQSSTDRMPPPPPRTMPPPPPPPKFNSISSALKEPQNVVLTTPNPESIPDTLIKLMEYGDEDDDPDDITEEPSKSNSNGSSVTTKPFWAV